MVEGNLDTTNLLLGIMAAVAVLEALVIIGIGVMGYRAYAKTMQMVQDVEAKHIAPLMTKVNGLMATVDGVVADVKGITARVGAQTERVDSAIRSTIDRVDETADHVRSSVAQRMQRAVGVMRGIRVAMDTLLHTDGHNGHGRGWSRTHGTASDTPGETHHG